MFHEVN